MTDKVFTKAITDPSFLHRYMNAGKHEIKELFGEDVAAMAGYDQRNPFHCHDLLTHSFMTVDAIKHDDLNYNDFLILRVAALLHDIGKPETALWDEKKQRIRFFDHARISAEKSRKKLSAWGIRDDQQRTTLFLIRHHEDFINFKTDQFLSVHGNNGYINITLKNINRLIRRNAMRDGYHATLKEYLLLLKLCAADVSAQSQFVNAEGNAISHTLERINTLGIIKRYLIDTFAVNCSA